MNVITVLLAEDHAVVREATVEIADHQPVSSQKSGAEPNLWISDIFYVIITTNL